MTRIYETTAAAAVAYAEAHVRFWAAIDALCEHNRIRAHRDAGTGAGEGT